MCLNTMKHVLFAACASVWILACHHKEAPPLKTTIHITSPVAGSEFDAGDTVRMSGTASSNMDIATLVLTVSKTVNDSVIYTKRLEAGRKAFDVSEYFINHLNPHADLVFSLQAFDSKAQLMGSDKVNFHCHAH